MVIYNMEEMIKEYVKNIDEYTINKFALSNKINLSDDEVKVIYLYIKNYWYEFYKGDPEYLFLELKDQLSDENYSKIIELYHKYKKKIN